MTGLTVFAVDWSGSLTDSSHKIWLAAVGRDVLGGIRLETGRDRLQLEQQLIEEARTNPNIVVGIDFAFSFPEWFLRDRGLANANALWALAAERGEQWLSVCEFPFWGRPHKTRPDLKEHYRRTDREVPAISGITPKSVFQIGGAGAVGTGSVRGMPMLNRLKQKGFSIWPFDDVAFPLVVEIYPRLLTGPVTKGSFEMRRQYLEAHYSALPDGIRETGASSEDAFDALVSALAMSAHAGEFAKLEKSTDELNRLEGRIWYPRDLVREPPSVQFSDTPQKTNLAHSDVANPKVARRSTSRRTTQIGFVNKNAQRVTAKTPLKGSDHNQKVYQLECTVCGYVYGANGSDIHSRRCPKHQGGQPGEPLE